MIVAQRRATFLLQIKEGRKREREEENEDGTTKGVKEDNKGGGA